ncbi:MAG: 2-oxoglutarate dehydrogenase complex dihydrolipoyllysine-residue succinyltransferase [Mariniphaga sp.]
MIIEIKIPSPGESITEVEVGRWLVENGAIVNNGQEIAEIESDKATLSISATASGKLTILVKEGERVAVGSVACTLDTADNIVVEDQKPVQSEIKSPEPVHEKPSQTEIRVSEIVENIPAPSGEADQQIKLTPAAKAVMEEEGLSVEELLNGLRRISRKDVETVISLRNSQPSKKEVVVEISRVEDRVAMTPLRRKLSQRLVAVKNETAMLTTFNEIDLSQLMELRNNYQKQFVDKYGLKVGFMSFFTKAASIALSKHPSVNSMIDGDDIITPRYHDIGIAVQTPKGLMVPVVRNAETKSIEAIEREIKELAEKARDKKLTIQEMTGGTFTITNGGVFGSLMSTPIINPPQSAILGMHSIKERPIAVNGKVEIRPMMYVALSYDHRIIDGKDSVGFLVKVKELIENPTKLLFEGKSPEEELLGL